MRPMSRAPTPPASSPPPEAGAGPPGLLQRVAESAVLKGPLVPRNDRERALVTVHTLLLHLRPVRLPRRTLRFTHTFGLGGSSLVLILILAASGLLLTLGYDPSPAAAYDSLARLENEVRFGSLVRGVHYWAATLLVLVVLAHLARVFLTGGYHGPRQFNWVIGCCLLLFVLANAFTGYLLPWDQIAYWAVTISTGMLGYLPGLGPLLQRVARGGAEIGPRTLILFYTLHTSIVPAVLIGFIAFHFWRVRKAGGVVVPPKRPDEPEGEDDKVLFVPHLLMRETAMALVVLALVVLLGAALGAPLGERANPGMSPNPAKAPWYFVGLQELLVHFHPAVTLFVLPAVLGLGFLLLPYWTSDAEPAGAWFLSERGRRASAAAAGAALVAVPIAVVLDARFAGGLAGSGFLVGGLLPLAGLVAAVAAVLALLRRRYALTRNESVQALVVLLSTTLVVLTIVGFAFRGAGMALAWPWSR
jgi:quinol-cytochrome oxidoreductase complex cytochrome b subunit